MSTGYDWTVQDWVPVPGSARARILTAGMAIFERDGFDAAGVIDIATTAGVTTGSLYHHFESKLGLFQVIRREMERRIRDRMEGAFEAAYETVGSGRARAGRAGANAAMLVGFDAAIKLRAVRILSDEPTGLEENTLAEALAELFAPAPEQAAGVMLGAWRAALRAAVSAAARGDTTAAGARAGLEWVLNCSS